MGRQPNPETLRRALARHAFADVSDATLLVRYTRHGDGEAFAELVRRYAGLVWSVCRRGLADEHQAEDAFQTTFTALARQAHAIRRVEALPAWLHGVARRTAGKLRTHASRQATASIPDVVERTPDPLQHVAGRELLDAVEEEVGRLPEKYRSALLACWFDDESLDAVAQRLGVTKGTLWGRLKRGREQLRARLSKRGFGLPAVLAVATLTGDRAPARLLDRAVKAGVQPAALQNAAAGFGLAATLKVVGAMACASALALGVYTLFPAPKSAGPPKKDAPPVVAALDDGFPLPPGAVRKFGNRQLRHPDEIHAGAVSPNGKLLATLGHMSVVVWDLQTLKARHTLTGDWYGISAFGDANVSLDFSPDSKALLVTVRPTQTTSIETHKPVELAQLWDLETGQKKFGLIGGWSWISAAWFVKDGREIVLQSGYGEKAVIRYVDARDGKELRTVKIPHKNHGAWLAREASLFAGRGNGDNGIDVVDAATGKDKLRLLDAKFVRMTLSRDGQRLAWIDAAGKIHIHDIDADKELLTIQHPEKDNPGPLLFARDNKTLYFGSNHGRLFRWDLQGNKKLPDFGNRHNFWNLSSLALNPDETVLFSFSHDHLVKRWDLKTGKEIPLPEGYTTQITMLPALDGRHLIMTDHEGQVDFWDLSTGVRVKQIQPAHLGGINCLAQSPDGRWLAAGRTSQDVRLFDLSTGKSVKDIYLGDNSDAKWGDTVQRVAFGPDGNVLYTSSTKTGITAYELPSGKQLWRTPAGRTFALDPNKRWLAVRCESNSEVIQWACLDPATGKERYKVTVEADAPVDPQSGFQREPFILDLIATPDGQLVTAHFNGTIRTWDVSDGREVARWKLPEEVYLFKPSQYTTKLAVSPDGKLIACGGRQTAVFERCSGKQVATFAGNAAEITQVAFTRSGRELLTNADLAPVLWPLAPAKLPKAGSDFDAHWQTLASADAVGAYALIWALAASPEVAVKMLTERVKPAELTVERKQFDEWIAALASPQFRAREMAERDVIKAGCKVPLEWLRQARAIAKDDEVVARLKRILAARTKRDDPNEWRLVRAVQILELAGTTDGQALLKSWAESGAGSLAIDAGAALARWQHSRRQ